MLRLVLILAFGLLLSGCATMSEEDCRYADWYSLGTGDGAQGRGQDYLSQRARACEKFGSQVDAASWRKGWQLGIQSFCVPERGFDTGLRGYSYSNSCPLELERDFLDGYALGYRIYAIGGEINLTDGRIAAIDEELTAEDLSSDYRRSLRNERRRLEQDIRELERERGALEATAYQHGYRW